MGTHHPKYWLVFGKDGSLFVIVSSANFSSPGAIEGSWVGMFPPLPRSARESSPRGLAVPTTFTEGERRGRRRIKGCNDFGHVLEDMIRQQGVQAHLPSSSYSPNMIHPVKFLRDFANFSLHDLPYLWDFSAAAVDLVATVPGDHRGRITNPPEREKYVPLYGPQRFAALMADKLSPSSSSYSLPPSSLSNADAFVLQQTSIGTKLHVNFVEQLSRSYFAQDDRRESTMEHVMENARIVWPEEVYMRECSRKARGGKLPKSNM